MIKANMKRGMALLLTAGMLMGLSLSVVDRISVHADANDDAASKPSLSAYASKGELQSEFNPGRDDASIGKLKLGKYNKADVEWYILGSDSGVVDDEEKAIENTAIFAASNIAGKMAFQSNGEWNYDSTSYMYKGDRTISAEKVTYDDEIGEPTSFWANHYGLSDVRNMLREMAEADSSIFSSAELDLMNKTNVKTEDPYNTNKGGSRYYTTSDKLYLPYGNNDKDQEITIGSDDSKALSRSKYWSKYWKIDGMYFWLRVPNSLYYGTGELCALPADVGGG